MKDFFQGILNQGGVRLMIDRISHFQLPILLIAGFLAGTLLDWPPVEIVFLLLFFVAYVKRIPSRHIIIPAFFLMGAVPLLLALKRVERAEEFSVYAYYVIAMTVVLAVRELREEGHEVTSDKP